MPQNFETTRWSDPVEVFRKDWLNMMTDRREFNPKSNREQPGSPRSAHCAPKASDRNQKDKRYVDITAMIRSLQRTEGLTDCFRRGIADCDQLECTWRQYCLGNTKGVMTDCDD